MNERFQIYLNAINPADPEWLRERIIAQAVHDPAISGLELKVLYDKAFSEVS